MTIDTKPSVVERYATSEQRRAINALALGLPPTQRPHSATNEARPCPFCHHAPTAEFDECIEEWFVACLAESCAAHPFVGPYQSRTEAVDAWNVGGTVRPWCAWGIYVTGLDFCTLGAYELYYDPGHAMEVAFEIANLLRTKGATFKYRYDSDIGAVWWGSDGSTIRVTPVRMISGPVTQRMAKPLAKRHLYMEDLSPIRRREL